MPSPEEIEYADLLLRKAEGDRAAVEALLDRDQIPDDILGFHAQQAVEKAMKAVLSLRGVDYPRIHDLRRLAELLEESGSDLPSAVERADWLTAWATEFRYADPPPPHLDRGAALGLAQAAIGWARSALAEAESQ